MENWRKFVNEHGAPHHMSQQQMALMHAIGDLSDTDLQHLLTKYRLTPDHPMALAAQEEATKRFQSAFSDATPEGGWAQGMEPTFPPEEDEGTLVTPEDEERAREDESEEDKYHRERAADHRRRWR
tara:strand:+ start:198 stop:575 length:378 start_codon:yes stop_codon:yes gene_type:complete